MHDERRASDAAPPCANCTCRREFFEKTGIAVAAAVFGLATARRALAMLSVTVGEAAAQSDTLLTYLIPVQDGVTIDRKNAVILVRFESAVYAFALSCPHENAALRWRAKDHRFQCPRHESKYTPDGVFMEGRATRNMDRFSVRKDGDNVIVDVAKLWHSDANDAEWAAASLKL